MLGAEVFANNNTVLLRRYPKRKEQL
jgi:hypothetical protein